jgi:anti-anti-sigma regulatory factor
MIQLCVEQHAPGIVVIRVAGELSLATAPRLARLLDTYLGETTLGSQPESRGNQRPRCMLVDCTDVRTFGIGGLDVLRHAQHVARQARIPLHLTGLREREAMLPRHVAALLPTFTMFGTLDEALEALTLQRAEQLSPAVVDRASHARRPRSDRSRGVPV